MAEGFELLAAFIDLKAQGADEVLSQIKAIESAVDQLTSGSQVIDVSLSGDTQGITGQAAGGLGSSLESLGSTSPQVDTATNALAGLSAQIDQLENRAEGITAVDQLLVKLSQINTDEARSEIERLFAAIDQLDQNAASASLDQFIGRLRNTDPVSRLSDELAEVETRIASGDLSGENLDIANRRAQQLGQSLSEVFNPGGGTGGAIETGIEPLLDQVDQLEARVSGQSPIDALRQSLVDLGGTQADDAIARIDVALESLSIAEAQQELDRFIATLRGGDEATRLSDQLAEVEARISSGELSGENLELANRRAQELGQSLSQLFNPGGGSGGAIDSGLGPLLSQVEQLESRLSTSSPLDALRSQLEAIGGTQAQDAIDRLDAAIIGLSLDQADQEFESFLANLRNSDPFTRLTAELAELETRISSGRLAGDDLVLAQARAASLRTELSSLAAPPVADDGLSDLIRRLEQVEATASGTSPIDRLREDLEALGTTDADDALARLQAAVDQIDSNKAISEIRQLAEFDPELRLTRRIVQLNNAIEDAADPAELQALTRQLNVAQDRLDQIRTESNRGGGILSGLLGGRGRRGQTRLLDFVSQLGFAAEDAQFGFRGLSNNIQPVLLSLFRLNGVGILIGATLIGALAGVAVAFIGFKRAVDSGDQSAIAFSRNLRDLASGIGAIIDRTGTFAFNFVLRTTGLDNIDPDSFFGSFLTNLISSGRQRTFAKAQVKANEEIEKTIKSLQENTSSLSNAQRTELEITNKINESISDQIKQREELEEKLASGAELTKSEQVALAQLRLEIRKLRSETAERVAVAVELAAIEDVNEIIQGLRDEVTSAQLSVAGLTTEEIKAAQAAEEFNKALEGVAATEAISELRLEFTKLNAELRAAQQEARVQSFVKGFSDVSGLQEQLRLLNVVESRIAEFPGLTERAIKAQRSKIEDQIEGIQDPFKATRDRLVDSFQTPLETGIESARELFKFLSSNPADIEFRTRGIEAIRKEIAEAVTPEDLDVNTVLSGTSESFALRREIQASFDSENFVNPILNKFDAQIRVLETIATPIDIDVSVN